MLNSTGEVVEQKWKDLVDTFCRKEKSGAGGMTIKEKSASWKFYDRMSFMHPYIQSRYLASWKFYDRMSFMHPYIQSRYFFKVCMVPIMHEKKNLHSTTHGLCFARPCVVLCRFFFTSMIGTMQTLTKYLLLLLKWYYVKCLFNGNTGKSSCNNPYYLGLFRTANQRRMFQLQAHQTAILKERKAPATMMMIILGEGMHLW